jgi:hypothetical protein
MGSNMACARWRQNAALRSQRSGDWSFGSLLPKLALAFHTVTCCGCCLLRMFKST